MYLVWLKLLFVLGKREKALAIAQKQHRIHVDCGVHNCKARSESKEFFFWYNQKTSH